MKKNITLFTGVATFVLLFYKQTLALNFSIFCLAIWLLLFYSTALKQRTKTFYWLAVALLFSAVSFAWYGDFISFAALLITTILLGYKTYYPQLNIITAPFSVFINYASFIVRAPLINKWLTPEKTSGGNILKKLIAYCLIPCFFVSIFLLVYTMSSEKFASFFIINWDIDLLQILGLSVFGFFVMFCYFHFYVPQFIIAQNSKLADDFPADYLSQKTFSYGVMDKNFVQKSGEISLVLLNILLLFFIITYSIESYARETTGSLSSSVHERVYTLIGSIAMAIAVIMLYFKGAFNFDSNARLLKILSFIWIGLNMVLLITVLTKNMLYVQSYGLTFKRIGVFVFLLLSSIGLLLTTYKLHRKKTNIFLLNRMLWVTYAMLVVFAAVNWSWIVTKYNINNHQSPTDWAYLHTLEYNKQLMHDLSKTQNTGADEKKVYDLVQDKKAKPFLSKNLYYEFLNLK